MNKEVVNTNGLKAGKMNAPEVRYFVGWLLREFSSFVGINPTYIPVGICLKRRSRRFHAFYPAENLLSDMKRETSTTIERTESENHPRQIRSSDRGVLQFVNSSVALEKGPAGVIARVDHRSGPVDYAGPLSKATIGALHDVAGYGGAE
jgi:hypothetical protein